MPSRFIDELPQDIVEIKDSTYLKNENFLDEFSQLEDLSPEYLSPGRKRLLSKRDNALDWEFNQDISTGFKNSIEGERVFHQKFGYGYIINLDGDKAEVNFDKSSNKKIFIKYLQFNL